MQPASHRAPAFISIDVDCMVGQPTKTNGQWSTLPASDEFVRRSFQDWLPPFLDLLARKAVKATFFLISDFAKQPTAQGTIRRIVAEGHEVASHSKSHAFDLRHLGRDRIRQEVLESKQVLEDISGTEVIGFRGPGYAFDAEIADLLLESGYRYDSSVVPGYFLDTYKILFGLYNLATVGRRLVFRNAPPSTRWSPYIVHRQGERALLELPLSVDPILTLPMVSFVLQGRARFSSSYRMTKLLARHLVYAFHDFEFIDQSKDGLSAMHIDGFLRGKSLEQRLALYEWQLGLIAQDFDCMTGADFVSRHIPAKSA